MDKVKRKATLILVCLCTNEEKSVINLLKSAIEVKEIDYIIIVDNQSTDNSREKILSLKNKKIKLIETDKDCGYGYGMNIGFKYVRSYFDTKYILTCNADIIINSTSVNDCLNYLRNNSEALAVSSLMKDMNDNIDLNWGYDINKKDVFKTATFFISQNSYKKIKKRAFKELQSSDSSFLNVPWIRGSFEMFRSDVLFQTALYDENIFMYGEENVLKKRLLDVRDGRFVILKNSFYYHNHVNKSSDFKIRRRYVKSSRLYYLKQYLYGTVFDTLWYRFLFFLGNIEYTLIHALHKKR